ncbi:MAG: hypothetical protein Q8N59_02755 [bacterium]|nr:hypothetical protein [bacterium]
MAATWEDIKKWFEAGVKEGATHMIVVCDTFDYDDYPVYVSKDEDVQGEYNKYHGKNMQQVMEVYSLRLDMEMQLNEERAFHFD